MLRRSIVLALCVCLSSLASWAGAPSSPSCQGGVLYGAAFAGINGQAASLYTIDTATGVATLVGPIGFKRVSGMDFHPATGVLYATAERTGSSTKVLITIDPATGIGTEVALLNGGVNHPFGDAYADVSFRNSDNALYAYLEANDGLGRIDIATGALTVLGATGVGCCGNGIAFLPGDVLYHANEDSLNTLDQSSGAATFVAALAFSPPADNNPRLNGLEFDPQGGVLYGSLADNSAPNFENYLATVDASTGVVTIIGPTVAGLDALALKSEPCDVFFSTLTNFFAGNTYLRHYNAYSVPLDGTSADIVQHGPTFLNSSPNLGLDALDVLPNGNVVFSTALNGFISHAGGSIYIRHQNVYELDLASGVITEVVNWAALGINLQNLDALDRLAGSHYAISPSTNHWVTHAGGMIYLRHDSVYEVDVATRTIAPAPLLNGASLNLSSLGVDAVDVLPDGRVAFSTASNGFVNTPAGPFYVRQQNAYVRNADGTIELYLDGAALRLENLDAISDGSAS